MGKGTAEGGSGRQACRQRERQWLHIIGAMAAHFPTRPSLPGKSFCQEKVECALNVDGSADRWSGARLQ